jgi:hypothetical protein
MGLIPEGVGGVSFGQTKWAEDEGEWFSEKNLESR